MKVIKNLQIKHLSDFYLDNKNKVVLYFIYLIVLSVILSRYILKALSVILSRQFKSHLYTTLIRDLEFSPQTLINILYRNIKKNTFLKYSWVVGFSELCLAI